MSNKHKITFSLSFVLALLFALPWITVVEQIRLSDFRLNNPPVTARVVFILATVFTTSVILFSYNFFWKKWLTKKGSRYYWLVNLLTNLLLVITLTVLIEVLAVLMFNIRAVVVYFILYFFRNAVIGVVVVLVAHVVDLIEELKQERIEVLLLQNQNAETELAALKNQLDPHFLFNTLTTLSSLVRNNSKETVPFIDHMADSFRYMLENRSQKVVTIRDEISFLRSYLFMMQKRFEEGLEIEIDVRQEHLERTVPQFALQVVVENAIKHNIISPKNPLRIHLKSDDTYINVRNSLRKKQSTQGYGIGLDNLAQRYWLTGKKKIKVSKGEDFFEVCLPLL